MLTNGFNSYIIIDMLNKKLKPSFGVTSIVLTVVAVLLTAVDLITKYLEERFAWNAAIIPNFIEISHGSRNPGCAFSFLADNPAIGQPILIALTFILLIALIVAFVFIPERFVIFKTSISIIVAGAVGNLVDRLAFMCVRDWFGLWMFGKITICNLADFWIVIGVVLAIIDLLFLNEIAVFPLTKKAKAAQAARKAAEDNKENAAKSENAEEQPVAELKDTEQPKEEPDGQDGIEL